MTSPNILKKITSKQRPFRVVILGQNGVGKSALTVRFLTRRFIGEYDPFLERVYSCTKCLDGDHVALEVLDTAVQEKHNRLEENIKWADAYILVYSVTDRCSFNECSRLRFLINSYAKRNRKTPSFSHEVHPGIFPVVLVGNQTDRVHDRMISEEEGRRRAYELGCIGFYEVSARESVDCVTVVFEDLYRCCRNPKKFKPLIKQTSLPLLPDDASRTFRESPNIDSSSKRRKALYTSS